MIVVSDTSALSALLTVDRLGLLQELFGEIRVPSAVLQELVLHHPDCSGIPYLRVETVKNVEAVRASQDQLDAGEAEAIQLALEQSADLLLIDESLGRSFALEHQIPIIGLMGILLMSKEKKLIPEVGPLIEEVECKAGFYLSRPLKKRILKDAGETEN